MSSESVIILVSRSITFSIDLPPKSVVLKWHTICFQSPFLAGFKIKKKNSFLSWHLNKDNIYCSYTKYLLIWHILAKLVKIILLQRNLNILKIYYYTIGSGLKYSFEKSIRERISVKHGSNLQLNCILRKTTLCGLC